MGQAKKEKISLKSIILFPENIKYSLIFLIVFLVIIFGTGVSAINYSVSSKRYNYYCEIDENLYYDYLAPYLRVVNSYNYNEDDDKIQKKTTVYVHYGTTSSSKKFVNLFGNYIIEDTKGNNYYHGDTSASKNETYSSTFNVCSNKIFEGEVKAVYGKVRYDQTTDGLNNQVMMFSEKMLTLSKNELKMEDRDDFTMTVQDGEFDPKKLFGTHLIDETKKQDNQIGPKLVILSNCPYKFHIDYQLFGVTAKGKAYSLVGYYNLCKRYDSSYGNNYSIVAELNKDSKNGITFEYYIAKCRVVTEEFGEKILYCKQSL